jgi:hypothetical protein
VLQSPPGYSSQEPALYSFFLRAFCWHFVSSDLFHDRHFPDHIKATRVGKSFLVKFAVGLHLESSSFISSYRLTM